MEERGSLGLLLALAPGEERGEALLARAVEAADRGEDVMLYLLDEGVLHLDRPEIDELAEAGARIYCCAYGAQRRGIEPSRRAVFSGLYILASLVAGCDRFEKRGMKVLVVIEADPRTSHKPAEALRVALGLSAGPLEVEVHLRGEARRALDETSELVDADILEANRTRLERAGVPIHVDGEPPEADRVIVFT